jgi:hypothetical protein
MPVSASEGRNQMLQWWYQRKFLALLLALGMLIIVYPILHGRLSTRLLLDILFTLVFVVALLMIFTEGRFRWLAFLLAVPTLVGAWIGYAFTGVPRVPLAVGCHLEAALFFALTVTTILRAIHKQTSVSADAIYGAFGGYIVVGLAFGHLYTFTEILSPGSFQVSPELATQLQADHLHHLLLTYFSLCTLTTVGYGDITPRSGAARSLAVVEAILGQFYLAVLIGELIGKRVSQVLADQSSSSAKTQG